MRFASWVAGQKLQGTGAQTALPWGKDVDETLGTTKKDVLSRLEGLISDFVAP